MFKMMATSLAQLFFPHYCMGCGTDILEPQEELCLRCISEMPATNFHMHAGNLCEKTFWGRIPVTAAASYCYFTKDSLIQHLLHQLKYKQQQGIGLYLGRLMGRWLRESNRFNHIDALVPLPLHAAKERKRGYNQAALLCEGMAISMQLPVLHQAVIRLSASETQTQKHRIERWENMQGRFLLQNAAALYGKHILLVDDVLTTGATLESCGEQLLLAQNTQLSIATLAYTIK